MLGQPPPEGFARWTGPLIATALGDVHVQYVWRFLRAQKIDLAARKSWCQSNDPEFAAKAAAIVGLYLDPPENALVLAVDEKPSIQALERRQGFLDFMNRLVARHPGREIHVILDNLNTHKPKNDRWLKRHPNVRFHFTPTAASWLNQVEIWFSILGGQSLQGASFNSLATLKQHIEQFISAYNETARRCQWTASQVHQKRLKARFADQ